MNVANHQSTKYKTKKWNQAPKDNTLEERFRLVNFLHADNDSLQYYW